MEYIKSLSLNSNIDLNEIYNVFFERSYEGLFIINEEKRILISNPTAESLLGYAKGELIDSTIEKVVPESYMDKCNGICEKFFSPKNAGKSIKSNMLFQRKDGSQITVEMSMSDHVHNTEGKLMIAVFDDITAEYQLTQNLKDITAIYENVQEKMGNAFLSVDKDWQITYINKIAIGMQTKFKKGTDFTNKYFWDVFPEMKGTTLEKMFRSVMETRNSVFFESPSIYFFDSWNEIHVSPNDNGISIFAKDITEVKQKRDELKKSEERFSKAFQSSPVSIAISSLEDDTFMDVNKSFLNLFEYNLNDVIGKTPKEIGLYNFCKLDELDMLNKALHEKYSISNFETTLRKNNGTPVYVLLSIENIDLNGSDHKLSTIVDITANKKSEETLAKLNELLESKVEERTQQLSEALNREKASSDLKSRFVSLASHEFRTPLTGLLTSVSILEKYTEQIKSDKMDRHFNRIKSSIHSLTDMLSEFLSLDKLEQGRQTIDPTNFNLHELMDDNIEEMNLVLKPNQRILLEFYGDNLIYQDKKIIWNTLLNLISNASKYSPEGSKIEIVTEVRNKLVQINVKDHGIGIPEEDQKNLFTIFFRAKNVENIQGTGLGLTIVKKYMELIGGFLSFTSEENVGTTFVANFPQFFNEHTSASIH